MISALFFFFGIGVWAPGLENISSISSPHHIFPPAKHWQYIPEISAKSAIVMDVASAGIIFEKNGDERLPMASLTKIMSALLILEENDLDELVKITQAASTSEGSTMKLQAGEVIRVRDLLKGLFIASGNDSAVALSIHNAGNISSFVEKMNTRSKSLSLVNTHFQNPHGLDASDHYSSARNLAVLAKKVLQYDIIRQIAKIKKVEVQSIDGRFSHILENTNELLGTIFPVSGLKTGTTDNAGECIILLVHHLQKEYILVILGSKNRYLDARALMFPILFGNS